MCVDIGEKFRLEHKLRNPVLQFLRTFVLHNHNNVSLLCSCFLLEELLVNTKWRLSFWITISLVVGRFENRWQGFHLISLVFPFEKVSSCSSLHIFYRSNSFPAHGYHLQYTVCCHGCRWDHVYVGLSFKLDGVFQWGHDNVNGLSTYLFYRFSTRLANKKPNRYCPKVFGNFSHWVQSCLSIYWLLDWTKVEVPQVEAIPRLRYEKSAAKRQDTKVESTSKIQGALQIKSFPQTLRFESDSRIE